MTPAFHDHFQIQKGHPDTLQFLIYHPRPLTPPKTPPKHEKKYKRE